MIEARAFVDAAREVGFDLYAGVPCSFLTPFINHVIDDEGLTYVSSANEGDAVATAAGAVLGGRGAVAMMQNSGLGNAVNPITSLLQTFQIPVLLIVTLRGDPDLPDEPQHEIMGAITPALFEAMQVPWEFFADEEDDIAPALTRARRSMTETSRPYAFVLRKGVVAGGKGNRPSTRPPVATPGTVEHFGCEPGGCERPAVPASRTEALRRIIEGTPVAETVVIATTGYTGRELAALADRDNHFYMVGSMGCASSLGLGLSLARPDLRVVVVDGDGALLMRMGNLATAGSYAGPNFVHVLLDNEVHDSTGGQATVSPGVSFATVAAACGYSRAVESRDPAVLDELFEPALAGARFVHLKIRSGAPVGLPRPDLRPPQIRERLMGHLSSHR